MVVGDEDPDRSGAYHPWVYDKVGLDDSAEDRARAEGKRVDVSKGVVPVEAMPDEGDVLVRNGWCYPWRRAEATHRVQ